MLNRRQILVGGGAAVTYLLKPNTVHTRPQTEETQIPAGGTPSIVNDGQNEGVVQFAYPDGTRIRIYDNKLLILRKDQKSEERPYFGIDISAVAMPAISADPVLNTWLNAHADDLRTTIRKLLRDDGASNSEYDAYERGRGLSVYKRIIVRHKYIKRLSRTE